MKIQKLKRRLISPSRQFGLALVVAIIAGSIGVYTLQASHAASFAVGKESESGVLAGSYTSGDIVGASNGASIKFGTTTAPSPTPPPTGGNNCINSPHVCGYPDETNTGVPAGITLTAYTGPEKITADNTVIDSKLISTPLCAVGKNIVLKNSKVVTSGGGACNGNQAILQTNDATNGSFIISNTEIDGQNGNVNSVAIGFGRWSCDHCHIHRVQDGTRAEGDNTLTNSYIHDIYYCGDTCHNDAVQSTGSSNVTVTHNTLSNPGHQNSIFQIGSEFGAPTNHLINNNLLDGGNFTINLGDGGGTGRTIKDNRFTRRYVYGIGNLHGQYIWTNNVWDDTGAVITGY